MYIYNGILLSHKKEWKLPFATTQMESEGIMLSKISQPRNTNTVCYHLYVELKTNKANEWIEQNRSRNRLVDIKNKSVATSREREWGRDKTGVGD